jgi:hypothetical protein
VGGCGKERPATIPISGQVTIDGQPPGGYGKIFFTPTHAASGYSKRPATGTFAPDGSYRVMSWEVDDGLVPGHYTLSVRPLDPAKTRIPDRYQQDTTSGLEVEVPVDQGDVVFNIDIVTK